MSATKYIAKLCHFQSIKCTVFFLLPSEKYSRSDFVLILAVSNIIHTNLILIETLCYIFIPLFTHYSLYTHNRKISKCLTSITVAWL